MKSSDEERDQSVLSAIRRRQKRATFFRKEEASGTKLLLFALLLALIGIGFFLSSGLQGIGAILFILAFFVGLVGLLQ